MQAAPGPRQLLPDIFPQQQGGAKPKHPQPGAPLRLTVPVFYFRGRWVRLEHSAWRALRLPFKIKSTAAHLDLQVSHLWSQPTANQNILKNEKS